MEEIFDFLNGEEMEDISTPDEEFAEWKKKKSTGGEWCLIISVWNGRTFRQCR